MAAPAAAAVADGAPGICFKVFDVQALMRIRPSGHVPANGDDVSPLFDPDVHTFADVMDWRLGTHPDDRDRVWAFQTNSNLVIGIDVSLDTPLRDWMAVLGMRADGTPVVLRPSHILNLSVEYEKVKYALAAHAAGLPWPLWDRADTDPINLQVTGSHDNARARNGSMMIPREEDNGIGNLIGLRRGRHLKFVNMHALSQSLVHGHEREPAFQTEIADVNEFARHLLIALQRSARPPASDPLSTLLPIIDLVTMAVDRRYGSAFAAYDRRVANRPLGEAGLRVVADKQASVAASNTFMSRVVISQRLHSFLLNHPDASIDDVEREGRRVRDMVPGTRTFPDADVVTIARETYRQMVRAPPAAAAAAPAPPARDALVAYIRSFMRSHPAVALADVENGVQQVRNWIKATSDFPLADMAVLVREEYGRALALARAGTSVPLPPAGAAPRDMLIGHIHAFVRDHPGVALAELEAGMKQMHSWMSATRDFPLVELESIVREEHRRAAAAARVVAPPAASSGRARNPLVEMYKAAFWAGGQDLPPPENAQEAHAAIARGGVEPGATRAFRRMLVVLGDIHARYANRGGQAWRDERRAFMITAIHAPYAEDEEEDEEEKDADGSRLAGRMDRQLTRW